MISQWYKLKTNAIAMRTEGHSIRDIEKYLKIPRSTLSYWFKDIELTDSQKEKLNTNLKIALHNAREKALIWHHLQKEKRLRDADKQAESVIDRVKTTNKDIIELALAFLYLGEGGKTETTSMGNSDPLVLRFFIAAIKYIFKDAKLAKPELHLRSDQDEQKEIEYWSNELSIAKENFGYVKDKRTIKSKTYSNYHGVCVVRFTSVAIQRQLVFLSRKFCNIIATLDP